MIWYNSPVKPSDPALFFVENVLITSSTTLLLSPFRYSTPSSVSFGTLCPKICLIHLSYLICWPMMVKVVPYDSFHFYHVGGSVSSFTPDFSNSSHLLFYLDEALFAFGHFSSFLFSIFIVFCSHPCYFLLSAFFEFSLFLFQGLKVVVGVRSFFFDRHYYKFIPKHCLTISRKTLIYSHFPLYQIIFKFLLWFIFWTICYLVMWFNVHVLENSLSLLVISYFIPTGEDTFYDFNPIKYI